LKYLTDSDRLISIGGTMRKLVLILIAFFAVVTFIRAFAETRSDAAAAVEYNEAGTNG
jgi:hypothetical protein